MISKCTTGRPMIRSFGVVSAYNVLGSVAINNHVEVFCNRASADTLHRPPSRTEEPSVPTSRSYRDACGIARALAVLGERWALLIVRELLLGPQRFADLRAALPQASSNIVTDRLRELGAHGVVARRRLPAPGASWVYELTPRGRAAEP